MSFLRRHTLPALVVATFLVACGSDSSVGPGTEQPPPEWSEIDNLLAQTTMYGLWAPREDLVIGVGPGGEIWQWGGQRWLPRPSNTAADLFSITGTTLGSVVVVGDGGTALEQVGGSFVPRTTPTTEDLRGVWRSGSGTFVAVGTHGVILRGNGTTWASDTSPTITSLFSVWGSSDNDIYTVGVGGTILHDNGAGWSPMQSGTTEILTAVSGTASNDVYAVGASGTIIHYSGSSWSPLASQSSDLLQSVCADCGPCTVGANGAIFRMINGSWSSERVGSAPWLYGVTNAGAHLWAVGAHALYRNTGSGWTPVTAGTIPVLRAMTSSATEGLVAVGDGGGTLLGGPDHWRFEDAGALQRLNAAWTTPSGEILAAGSNHIYRYAPGGWVSENEEIIQYFDIGGNSDQVFAVGSAGAIRERHGTAWSFVASPTGEELHAVTLTPTGGYIVGARGHILHLENSGWDLKHEYPGDVLWDVMPISAGAWRAVAVGAGGIAWGLPREIGSPWTRMSSPVLSSLYSMARGPGGLIYAVGVNGVVLKLENDEWRTAPSPASRTFLNAYSVGDDLFVCGGSGAGGGILFRYGTPDP